VRDHGTGSGPTAARTLFRPFSKRAAQAAGSAPGVGLGLALSQRLAQQLGGDLRFEPTPGGGATFLLTLPATVAQAE
jgi:signal transduction histidine kinase